jgi:hypothetical protein
MSCAVQLGKKWREEEKGGDNGHSAPFGAGTTVRAVGGSGLGVPHGGGEGGRGVRPRVIGRHDSGGGGSRSGTKTGDERGGGRH